jgi:hypothetical protein
MENWIQQFLLGRQFKACLLASTIVSASVFAGGLRSVDNEVFELGVNAGMINIEDFGSELTFGVSGSFKATEDFFLQVNYFQATSDLSSVEKSQGQLFGGADRDFRHFDLLVGLNIFQSEFAFKGGEANLASFYVVGGVGDTAFGGEESFTYTLGAGYQVAFNRHYIVKLDYRNYTYNSNLSDDDKTVNNGGFSLGVNYLF